MALPTKKIPELTAYGAALQGTEMLEIWAVSTSRRITARDFVLPADALLTAVDQGSTLTASRFLVAGAGIQFTDGGPGGPFIIDIVGTGANPGNPTALVGLTPINGAAPTWMRSDAAPALDQDIDPVWTGFHEFQAGALASDFDAPIYVIRGADPFMRVIEEDAAADNRIYQLRAFSETLSWQLGSELLAFVDFMTVDRTANVCDEIDFTTTSLRWNNTPLSTAAGANPSASVGLAAVNGAATTFMRSDAAPALSQAITPTWTNPHVFAGAAPQITLSSTVAQLGLNETDAAANNRRWDIHINSEQFNLRATDDAVSSATSFMVVDRTLNTIDSMALTATTFSFTGTIVNPLLRQTREQFNSQTWAAGANNLDLSLGNLHRITLNGNVTLAFTNPPPNSTLGVTFTIFLLQDGTGTRTVTWPASVHWSDGVAPTLTVTASRMDAVTLTTFDGGTTYFGGQVLANMVP